MNKKIIANRFGLVVLMSLSLFASTSAFAAAAQGPQQVVVTNSAAQPVPMSGLVYVQNSPAQPIPVTMADKQLYQLSKTANFQAATLSFNFTVPSGKKFVVQNINLSASTTDPACTFSAYGQDDSYPFSLGLSKSAAPIGISTLWGGQNQMQFTAQTGIGVWVNTSGCTNGTASVLVSGFVF